VVPGVGDGAAFHVGPLVFPNPVLPSHGSVRFDWLTSGARVQVFDLLGRRIWLETATETGSVDWNLKDPSGVRAAPGVYFYVVDGVLGQKDKLAIIN
jgi:hypothetical protein